MERANPSLVFAYKNFSICDKNSFVLVDPRTVAQRYIWIPTPHFEYHCLVLLQIIIILS